MQFPAPIPIVFLMLCAFFIAPARAEVLERVRVAKSGRGFMLHPSGKAFQPKGYNYDHDGAGRLLEDYWLGEWPSVEQDFAEMKALGANVVRIHLQVGKFLRGADSPDETSLRQLGKLLVLAERTGLYLDLTGLGCYHKKDVPAWYDALDEAGRWAAQARFWEAVAERCKDSSAIFCYDLMNEPLAPGSRQNNWLGPEWNGNSFVQYISRKRGHRERWQVARQWIDKLKSAIRRHDSAHLITIGLVDWSLDRPGLASGFVPERITPPLDFLCVHIYPKKEKGDEAIERLAAFAAVGKPVVIEETYPLKCSQEEFTRFLDRSKVHASGWISFYWGVSAAEYRKRLDFSGPKRAAAIEQFSQWRP